MPDQALTSLTERLKRAAAGDSEARDVVLPLLYAELRELAERELRGGGPNTLQPTALVHELYLKLFAGSGELRVQDRGHFFALAAKSLRSICVDHVRERRALKRGGDLLKVELSPDVAAIESETGDILALDAALVKLELHDPELSRVVELRYFAGLSVEDTAKALAVSQATVVRRFSVARLWLKRELSD